MPANKSNKNLPDTIPAPPPLSEYKNGQKKYCDAAVDFIIACLKHRMTAGEACEMLGISQRSWNRWIENYKYARKQVDDYEESNNAKINEIKKNLPGNAIIEIDKRIKNGTARDSTLTAVAGYDKPNNNIHVGDINNTQINQLQIQFMDTSPESISDEIREIEKELDNDDEE